MNRRAFIHRLVAPISAGSVVAALLGGAVVVAPPAAAATFDCLSTVSPTTGVTATMVGSDCVITLPYGGSGSSTTYTWTRPSFLTRLDYLVVGGGGGGGSDRSYSGYSDTSTNTPSLPVTSDDKRIGGGGGGGGQVIHNAQNIDDSVTTLTIQVGSGGSPASSQNAGGNSGNSSSISGTGFTTASASGGGGGSSNSAGGSSSPYSGGAQFSGSQCFLYTYRSQRKCSGAGGGGAGAGGSGNSAGTNGTGIGAGGTGIASDITGSTVTYGRGGNGGDNGWGGGNAVPGTDGTGNGGGGGATASNGPYLGARGGSGIVILSFSTKASALTTEPPASAVVDQTLTQSPVVTLTEAGVAASGVSVTVALDSVVKPAPVDLQIGPFLDGTKTVQTDASGVATFNDLSIRGPTGDYKLTFSASGYVTLTSITIAVSVGDLDGLAVTQSGGFTALGEQTAGAAFLSRVTAIDAGGNTVAGFTGNVDLTSDAFPGTVTASISTNGYADSVSLTAQTAGSGRTLTATNGSVTSTTSFNVVAGAADNLSIETPPLPGTASTGVNFQSQPVIKVTDQYNNLKAGTAVLAALVVVSGGTGNETLTWANSPTAPTSGVDGLATFSDLKINNGAASAVYRLTFSSGGLSVQSDTFSLAKIPTTVTWTPNPADTTATMLANPKQIDPQVNATVDVGSGAITYSVVDAGTTGCEVPDPTSRIVTFQTFGICQVTASAAETADYAASTLASAINFEISKVAQSITFDPVTDGEVSNPEAYATTPLAISASVDSGLRAVFESDTPTICSVVGEGLPLSSSSVSIQSAAVTGASVMMLKTGTCTIRATQPGNAIYSAATAVPRSFVIDPGTQAALTFSNATSVDFGSTLTLQTTGGSGPGAVTYALVGGAGTAGCGLDTATGAMTFTQAGTCVVKATKAGGDIYDPKSTNDTTITVTPADQSVAFTSSVPTSPLPGETYAVAAEATPSNNTVDLAVTTPAICSIDNATSPATVTFNATGDCIITADSGAVANQYNAANQVTQTIAVGSLNQTITFAAPGNKDFGSPAFALSGSASSGLSVSFATTTGSVCSVTAGGTVTPLAVGTCSITASQAGNAQYAAASDLVRTFDVVAVTPRAPHITSASAGDGRITIALNAPGFTGGAPIVGYQLVATGTGGPFTAPCDDLTAPIVCTIFGLTNGEAYTVTAAAINSAGVGTASIASPSLTPAAAAMAVTNAFAVPGDGQIELSFDAITTGGLGGGTFTRYEIYQRETGYSWPLSVTRTVATQGSGLLTQTFTDLNNGTSYEYKVVVITSANTEEITGNTTIVTEFPSTVPAAPVGPVSLLRTTNSAVVSWSEPVTDGGAEITDYVVSFSPSGSCGTVTIDPDSRVGSCTATGLAYSTTFTITVRAKNRMGNGPAATVTPPLVTGADPNPGGGGGSGGSGESGSGESSGGASGGSGNSGGSGGSGGSDGPRAPFPPTVPTPDGPSDEDIEEVLKKPSTGSISELPTLPIVRGTGPMPGGNGQLSSGVRSKVKGVEVMPTSSAELAAALAAGSQVVMASSSAQVGYMTSNRITIAPSTMLQVVTSLEPDDQQIAFRLWMQDRTGAWFRMGRTTSVDGQVVFPVMQFDTPGTYQVIATSVRGSRAIDADGNPVWGSTTVRTVVIVTPRQELGTKVCPNMIAFDQRSAMLSKKTKRQIRKLAECLGAMPAIKVSGYVGQAVRPAAAKRMAYLRARNVRNYLRDLGYDGGAKIRTNIELRPASCESTNNRCALVRLELGNERASERAAWDLVAPAEILDDGVAVDSGGADVRPPIQSAGEPVIAASVDSGGHDPTQLLAQEST